MAELVLFSTVEASAVWGVTRTTVERWVKSGRVQPARRLGRAFLFTPAEIDRVSKLPRDRRGRRPAGVAPRVGGGARHERVAS